MRIIKISSLPLMKGFYAINIFGIVFARTKLNKTEQRHEYIHTLQQREMLYVPFYIWYIVEWIIKLIIYRDALTAYRNIGFEKEAYLHQGDASYIWKRKRYAWFTFYS